MRAECTWALWESKIIINAATFSRPPKDLSQLERWTFVDAFMTKPDCQDGKEKTMNDLYVSLSKSKKDEEQSEKLTKEKETITDSSQGSYTRIKFKCIPDTIDPRGK